MTTKRLAGSTTNHSNVSMTLSPGPGSLPSSVLLVANAGAAVASTSAAAQTVEARSRRMVTGSTVLVAGDRVGQPPGERAGHQVVEQHRRPGPVGERQPPVGVLVVGARLVHGPPVADDVGQRDAEQAAPGRGQG